MNTPLSSTHSGIYALGRGVGAADGLAHSGRTQPTGGHKEARVEGEAIRTSLACPLDRLEPHKRARLRRFLKKVEQPRRKLRAASVNGSLDGRADRFIRISYRPRTAPGYVGAGENKGARCNGMGRVH